MCVASVPILLAASLVTGVAGTAMSYAASQQQAKAQESAANYNAQVAANNQIIAQQNAKQALQAGEAQEQQQRMKTAALIGSQRAAQAANGIQIDSGSALDVQSSAAELGELDALTIRSNASKTAYNYEAQAANYGSQAALDKAQAGWASQAGDIAGYSTLLTGASSLSSKWLLANQGGVLGSSTTLGSNAFQTPGWYSGKGYTDGYGF